MHINQNLSVLIPRIEGRDAEILKEASQESGLRIVTEVMDTREVKLVSKYADVLRLVQETCKTSHFSRKLVEQINLYYSSEVNLQPIENY